MLRKRLTLLRHVMNGHRLRYAMAVFAMALSVLIGFVTPLVLSETIDAVIGGVRPLRIPGAAGEWVARMGGRTFLAERLWIIAFFLLALNALGGFFQYLRGRFTAQASEAIAKELRDRLYDRLQRLPYAYHVGAKTGDLIQRCTSDVETVRRFLSAQLVEVFRTVLMVALAATIMVRVNAALALRSMLLLPVLAAMAFFFYRRVNRRFQAMDEAEGRLSAVLQENLAGVRVVRAFGRQAYETEKFSAANDDMCRKTRRLSDVMALFWPLGDLIGMAQTLLTLCFGVMSAARGELTVGEMTVFVSYVSMLLWPVRQMGRILSDFGKAAVSLGRIGEILNEPAEDMNAGGLTPPLDRDVRFEHVGFAYADGRSVLADVDFTAKAGQTVAILGATGSGKSTVALLMQRLYDATEGRVTIGGVDIRAMDKAYLRARVGLVLQEPFLYSRSIRENMTMAAPGASRQAFERAARDADVKSFAADFARGFDTVVGERGVTLSGGQKQRVAIARTLLRDADILVFDDSLSAVDTATDARIRAALRSRAGRATTFIVSHRMSTLREADLILVLEDGRVAQRGTHEELIRQGGLYERVYRIQARAADGSEEA